jgi:tRNA-specific adenosine deaminase 3
VLLVSSKQVASVCAFLKAQSLDAQPALKHLKRVNRKANQPEPVHVLLCPTSLLPLECLTEKLVDSKHLAHISVDTVGSPEVVQVPASPARTIQQMKDWTARIWPVSLIPIKEDVLAKERVQSWTAGKLAWMKRMCEATVSQAQEARVKGEHPIACVVAETWDPSRHSLAANAAPTVLATSHDTRLSTSNPLSHSVLNLVEAVAHLDRTDTRPIMPDSNYLLTNLTAFITHEPCLLCSMALLHSRISCLVYLRSSNGAGGCGSEYSLHEQKGTNHHFEAWCAKEDGEWKEMVASVQVMTLDP